MAILCRDYGVDGIFISVMICKRGKFLNEKVRRTNFLLKLICEEHGYFLTIVILKLEAYGKMVYIY